MKIRNDIFKNCWGVSLMEMLITIAIVVFAIAVLHTGFSAGNVSWKTHEAKVIVQRDARQTLFTMIKELREASSQPEETDTAEYKQLSFTRPGYDTVIYRRYKTGNQENQVIRTCQGADTTIANNISNLDFDSQANYVIVDLTAAKALANGPEISIHLKEKTALRSP